MGYKTTLGVCWFQPEQWQQAKMMFVDSATFGEDYPAWRKKATTTVTKLQAEGHKPVKMKINLDEFSSWANEKGLPFDARARAQFMTEKLRK